ncbi:MAG: hypothetical protein JWP44_5109 [Mucilaginibacter sp.]|nr:hypothetical protein [Mucilaginibacter sp.]
MSNYPDANLLASIRNKFSRYSVAECEYALQDIRATAQYHGPGEYMNKLLAERDAALDRLAVLRKAKVCKHCNGTGLDHG